MQTTDSNLSTAASNISVSFKTFLSLHNLLTKKSLPVTFGTYFIWNTGSLIFVFKMKPFFTLAFSIFYFAPGVFILHSILATCLSVSMEDNLILQNLFPMKVSQRFPIRCIVKPHKTQSTFWTDDNERILYIKDRLWDYPKRACFKKVQKIKINI